MQFARDQDLITRVEVSPHGPEASSPQLAVGKHLSADGSANDEPRTTSIAPCDTSIRPSCDDRRFANAWRLSTWSRASARGLSAHLSS